MAFRADATFVTIAVVSREPRADCLRKRLHSALSAAASRSVSDTMVGGGCIVVLGEQRALFAPLLNVRGRPLFGAGLCATRRGTAVSTRVLLVERQRAAAGDEMLARMVSGSWA